MQMALNEYRLLGGFNEDDIAKKIEGFFVVRPDLIAIKYGVGKKAFRDRIEGKLKHEKKGGTHLLDKDE